MAFFTSKEVNGLQEFGNFRKFLYMIKVSFLNLCVTEFRLAALHLSGQTASSLLRAILMFGLRGNQGMRDKKGIQGIGKWFELVDEYKQEVIQFAMLQVQPKQMKSNPRQVPISCRNVFNARLLQENFQSGQHQAFTLVYIPKLALLFSQVRKILPWLVTRNGCSAARMAN